MFRLLCFLLSGGSQPHFIREIARKAEPNNRNEPSDTDDLNRYGLQGSPRFEPMLPPGMDRYIPEEDPRTGVRAVRGNDSKEGIGGPRECGFHLN